MIAPAPEWLVGGLADISNNSAFAVGLSAPFNPPAAAAFGGISVLSGGASYLLRPTPLRTTTGALIDLGTHALPGVANPIVNQLSKEGANRFFGDR